MKRSFRINLQTLSFIINRCQFSEAKIIIYRQKNIEFNKEKNVILSNNVTRYEKKDFIQTKFLISYY